MSYAKRWCYTINNYTDEYPLDDICDYHVYGREIGESGTPHLQGFIIFTQRKRLTQLHRLLPGGHYEVTKGSNLQAADYCKKGGDFVEIGEMPIDGSDKGGIATKEKLDIVTGKQIGRASCRERVLRLV